MRWQARLLLDVRFLTKARCFWATWFPDFRVNGFSRIGRAVKGGVRQPSRREVDAVEEVLELRVGAEGVKLGAHWESS